jgi:hypothetical protein
MNNVHDRLSSERPSLVARVVQSESVTSGIMGFINAFWATSRLQGKPVAGVRVGEIAACSGDIFRAPLYWVPTMIGTAMNPYGKGSDFLEFMKAKARAMAGVIYLNPHLEKFFERVVDAIDQWSKHKGCSFSEVSIEDPIITKDFGTVQFRLAKGIQHKPLSLDAILKEAEWIEEQKRLRGGLVHATA